MAIPAAAALSRKLGLVLLCCIILLVRAFLSCALFPFSSRPPNLLSDPAAHTNLLELAPSLAALDLHNSDWNWRHDSGDTAQHLLQTLTAAAGASTNSRSVLHSVTANIRLRRALHNASAIAPTRLCHWLKDDIPAASISLQQPVLIAGLLTSNEPLMPHYILQLLQFVVAKPAQSLFVSIYESGSTDKTGLWLAVLAELLSALGVPHLIITGGSTRHEEEDRIQFLARVRNKALEPLWWPQNISRHDVMQPADSQTIYSSFPDHITNTNLSSSSTHSSSSSSAHSKHWFFTADKVVFLNDVYFCAQHVHRLLAHEGVNLACGLDHYQARVAQKFPESWRMNVRGLQFLRFYDNWVARDAEGTIFRRSYNNVVSDAYGMQRIHQGMAFPVTCCWNGLAVFDAAPLQESGLQFRSAAEGDCPASECSHFCEDLRRMRFDKMIVDPAVRLAYTLDVAAVLDKGKWQTFAPWSAAQHSPPDWTQVVRKPDMMCCPEPAIHACYSRSIYERNYTSPKL